MTVRQYKRKGLFRFYRSISSYEFKTFLAQGVGHHLRSRCTAPSFTDPDRHTGMDREFSVTALGQLDGADRNLFFVGLVVEIIVYPVRIDFLK